MNWRPMTLESSSNVNLHDTSDAMYHSRHSRRSLRRSVALGQQMNPGGRVLDVGCNLGITSQYLLDSGVAESVTGVEIYRDTVDQSLLEHPDFTLIESDVVKLSLAESYDYVVYGAVHHHVLHLHGLSAAVDCLQNLANHCTDTLLFETGHITEGARWPWQNSIRRYFRSDEEHLHYMLSCIEHRMVDFSIVGRFWIHGVRRAYIAVKMIPPDALREDCRVSPLHGIDRSKLVWQGRTFGSERQTIGFEHGGAGDSPTNFSVAQCRHRGALFLKRHVHRPYAAVREAALGEQVRLDWAVRPIDICRESDTLIFPYIDSFIRFSDLRDLDRRTCHTLATRLVQVFREASQHHVEVDSELLLPSQGTPTVLQLCDLNRNNILVRITSTSLEVKVVDFEYFSGNNIARNRLHLSRMLGTLGSHRLTALWLAVVGYVGQVCEVQSSQTHSLKWRICNRRPAFLSLLVTSVRTRGSRFEQWLVNMIRRW